jgi:U3 small nucleolar RNA-associated protein 20
MCPSLAEKHNRELVPLLLSFVDPESPSKFARQKLSQWLTLFSKFTNPKAFYATEKLQTLYVELLSHPDRSLQKLALATMLTYKSPHILPHQGTLEALLDDTRWRDELTALDISQIEEKDRRECVELVIRLLFGIMLEKRGRARGGDRRATIISALGGCRDEELEVLVKLMLDPLRKHMTSRSGEDFVVCSVSEDLSEKQQIGYLNLLEDVLKNLGSRLVAYWPALLGTTLDLLANAQRRIDASKQDEGAESSDDEVEEESETAVTSSKMIRVIRQLALKRLAEFFKCPVSFAFSPYMKVLFDTAISPRLASLDSENTQAPSALLEMIYVWSSRSEYAQFLTDFDNRTLPKVYDCLIATNVKPAVISRIFDVISGLLALSSTSEIILETVVKPHVSQLLTNLAMLVELTKDVASVSNSLGQRQIFILSEIAQYISDEKQASTLLGLFIPLLRRPSKIVPEKVKIDMMKIVSNLLPLVPGLRDRESDVYAKTWALLSRLLQSLRARSARLGVISAFGQFSKIDTSLLSLVQLLESLNAYSIKRTEEPDFDRRMAAFTNLNEEFRFTLSSTQWLPILCNMLYFIQDPTELALRTNASFTLRSFIDVVAQSDDKQWETTFLKFLYPGLKNGLRSKNELVRAEVLGVVAHAVVQCRNIGTLQEMRGLLADGDEEANFFNNIHHVQIHRRTRALRRLADYCNDGKLRSSTLADVFVPLVGNYVGATDSIDHNLVNEAITTIGRMACRLAWGSYNALVQHYLQQTKHKDASERIYVRTIVAILDNFHFQMDDTAVDIEREDEEEGGAEVDTAKARETTRIADAVNSRLIPALLLHLEKRDENEDSIRIPISVGIVNVVKHLPEHTREMQVTRLLTVLSQVFRSKSQDTRDLTRDALCRIAVNLGPAYLSNIIRELRTALLRGPHLHVLAVVTHALLVHVTSVDHIESFTMMDDCVEDVAHISAEVIFGQSGKDTQSEGFKTKMREVRSSSSKGLDSFTIVAKHITPIKVSSLLHPVRSILQETETLKVLQQADDVLRRIAVGLNSNKHLIPSELLPLCHTLIGQNSRFLQDPLRRKRSKKDKGSAIVQLKRPAPTNSDHYASNSFRFVASICLSTINTKP